MKVERKNVEGVAGFLSLLPVLLQVVVFGLIAAWLVKFIVGTIPSSALDYLKVIARAGMSALGRLFAL